MALTELESQCIGSMQGHEETLVGSQDHQRRLGERPSTMTNLEGACHAIFGPARQNMAAIFCPHGPNMVAIFGPLDLAILFCPPVIIPLLFV